jgi:hypothetical protein
VAIGGESNDEVRQGSRIPARPFFFRQQTPISRERRITIMPDKPVVKGISKKTFTNGTKETFDITGEKFSTNVKVKLREKGGNPDAHGWQQDNDHYTSTDGGTKIRVSGTPRKAKESEIGTTSAGDLTVTVTNNPDTASAVSSDEKGNAVTYSS